MTVGIDIVDIEDFQTKLNSSAEFLNKIFLLEELASRNVVTLAGKFAAKEALIKCGYILPSAWLDVKILNRPDGAPFVTTAIGEPVTFIQISISHTPKTAVAVAIYDNR